jgi:type II secretory pathway pseudopilin PulG
MRELKREGTHADSPWAGTKGKVAADVSAADGASQRGKQAEQARAEAVAAAEAQRQAGIQAQATERAENCGAPLFVNGYCPTDEQIATENQAERKKRGHASPGPRVDQLAQAGGRHVASSGGGLGLGSPGPIIHSGGTSQ